MAKESLNVLTLQQCQGWPLREKLLYPVEKLQSWLLVTQASSVFSKKVSFKHNWGQAWWYRLVTPALGWSRQEDRDTHARLGCLVRPCLTWANMPTTGAMIALLTFQNVSFTAKHTDSDDEHVSLFFTANHKTSTYLSSLGFNIQESAQRICFTLCWI